ncbi:forkhead box protein N5 isoform X2 [Tribolium castaneum]|uniref:forkhead box protein N5 isoform X2 n=1 Tax=Tribolium castaneum TaxID=7070 RepID=UPI00046C32E4|nr:PREDICTED: forkhead box protein N5 isoform X2 [Tribolium castaneum]|eukprot:XP_008201698.1 PREDICTED: forkhead box protein N5 isoform X2 [Tribolium castaneum]
MTSNNLIIRSVVQCKTPLLEPKSVEEPPTKRQKIIHGYALPQIAIKSEEKNCSKSCNEVLLVNGCWDTSNRIPNIVAEMHNIHSEEIKALQTCSFNESRDFLNPSPRGSDSGIESDCTDGNLSWLLNYRIHELPPVPDTSAETLNYHASLSNTPDIIIRTGNSAEVLSSELSRLVATKPPLRDSYSPKNQSYRYAGPKKPPFTYTELIEHALSEKGELTVSGIYQWISEHFPFYKQNDDRWKNSVRHNLSINPHFRKGSKAVHGAGHLWTIAQKDDKKTWQIKQRMQQFIQATYKENRNSEQEALDMELQAATASILGESFNEFDPNDADERKQNIEVEFINVVDIQNGLEDFLSPPVSKQQIVQECGLGNDFLITDLNPNTLGLNLTEGEVINDGSFYDDISFEYYELEKE